MGHEVLPRNDDATSGSDRYYLLEPTSSFSHAMRRAQMSAGGADAVDVCCASASAAAAAAAALLLLLNLLGPYHPVH